MVLEIAIISGLLSVIAALLGKITLFNGRKVHNTDNPIDTTKTPVSDMSVYFLMEKLTSMEKNIIAAIKDDK